MINIRKNIILKMETYYQTGGECRFFCTPHSLDEVFEAILWGQHKGVPIFILGEGSNTLYSDEFFPGLVISLKNCRVKYHTKDGVFLGCGLTNSELANYGLFYRCKDFSWLLAMPGLIGASIRINAKFFDHEMKDVTKKVLCLKPNFEIKVYDGREFFLDYKKTLATEEPLLVLGGWFDFPENGVLEDIKKERKDVINFRLKRHHFDFPSCGSVFKNHRDNGAPIGMLVEKLGLKGLRVGGARVSWHHGNFIWNENQAKSREIYALMKYLQNQLQKNRWQAEFEVDFKGFFPIRHQMRLLGTWPYHYVNRRRMGFLKQAWRDTMAFLGLVDTSWDYNS